MERWTERDRETERQGNESLLRGEGLGGKGGETGGRRAMRRTSCKTAKERQGRLREEGRKGGREEERKGGREEKTTRRTSCTTAHARVKLA